MRTEHRDQASICPFALREVSVLAELALGHLRYSLTDVPPQSNSPPGSVHESGHAGAYNDASEQRTQHPIYNADAHHQIAPPKRHNAAARIRTQRSVT